MTKTALAAACTALVLTLSNCATPTAPGTVSVSRVHFTSVAVPGTSAATAVQLFGDLHLPPADAGSVGAVVILPTSSRIQSYREPYYAQTLAEAGIAALVVDSFGARGIVSAVENQDAITSYQLEADAFGALAFLRAHARIRNDAIAIMGVSKGGTAALNSVFLIREQWRRANARFAAHVAISPDCTVPHRSASTTGAHLLIVLAEHDDYAPPAPCRDYAARITTTPQARVTVHEVAGATHGWEKLGEPQYIATAENFSRCAGIMEDDGRISVAGHEAPLTSAEYRTWARANCVTFGATSGGGTAFLRDAVTATIRAFLQASL